MSSERPRRSVSRNTYTTRSGKTIKLQQSAGDRRKSTKEAAARRKAAYLSGLPVEKWKRVLYRLSPKRLYHYWFSREGGVMALKVMGVGFVVGFLLIVGIFAYFRKDLPQIKDISGNNFGGSVTYYDRSGQTVLFQDYEDRKRVPVADKDISKFMKDATIAIEDKNFYNHGAFDVKGITRAIVTDLRGGQRQGGSTITQQLVKINEGWTNDRTITRKVKELILAVELEREYNKDEILVGYLNMAPYGGVDYGVETAAQDYFKVSAKDLTLPQAAMLAAIPKAPGSLSPFSSPQFNPSLAESYFNEEALIGRQRYVLDQMADQGKISQKEADAAKKVDILAQVKQLEAHYANIKAPYFVLAAKKELQKTFPSVVVKRGGWKVITTVDMSLQNLAEQSIEKGKARMSYQNADSVAFVAEDNATGQVLALVGGSDFNNDEYGKINYATDVNISPGSSIKPYDYVSFIDNNTNVGAGSVLYDKVGALPQYPCTNKSLPESNAGGNCLFDFDRKSPGAMTLRYALGGSRNIPAVKAFVSSVPNDTSNNKVNSVNHTMGVIKGLMNDDDGYRCFKSGTDMTAPTKADETQCYSAAGIGDGAYLNLDDHVNGIASISRLGKAIPKTYILKVTNSSGKTLKEFKQPEGKQVVKEDAAYIVTDMAADPNASYLGNSCNANDCSGLKFHRYKGWHNAIKTGTTNDLYDGLMVSWNKRISAGIWVGNHTRTVSYSGQPENMTAPIMGSFMKGAIDTFGAADNWKQPEGIKVLPAYVNRIKTASAQVVPSGTTDIFPSWYTGKTTNTSQTLDKVSNKVATSCTPSLAKQTAANSNASSWNVDIFAGGTTGAQAAQIGTDDIHNCNDTKPTVSITAVNGSAVSEGGVIDCPASGCSIMAYVQQGTHALTDAARTSFPGTINLSINGTQVMSDSVSASGSHQFNYVPATGVSGKVTVTVQIIDSVLYDSTATTSIDVQARPSSNSSDETNETTNSSPRNNSSSGR